MTDWQPEIKKKNAWWRRIILNIDNNQIFVISRKKSVNEYNEWMIFEVKNVPVSVKRMYVAAQESL